MDDAQQEVEALRMAVEHRTTIGIALGLLIERFDLSRDEAFARLQQMSCAREMTLYDMAAGLAEDHKLMPGGDSHPW